MSTISTSLAKPPLSYQNLIIFLVHSNGFFDDERRNQLFHGICAAKYWNHVRVEKSAFPWYLSGKVLELCQNCRFMGVEKPKRDQNPRFLWWF